METEELDLERYLRDGVEGVVKGILKSTLLCPEESAFLLRFAAAARAASARREAAPEHIPAFLIASVTSVCNLHCAGCYARSLDACGEAEDGGALTGAEWGAVFQEARELGVSFILLAGGEPMLRRDVLEAAAGCPDILFPVFTNGTLLRGEDLERFDRHRNLVPVLSIEGDAARTDLRRGAGVWARVSEAMEELCRRRLLYAVSVTVTRRNLEEVTSEAFVRDLQARGCRVVVYVEYVPVAHETEPLAPGARERAVFNDRLDVLRKVCGEMLLISFPGDEQRSGGCLAAGRGFFHINAHGGAEPCPFSPYSDASVRTLGLRGALASPLFTALREGGLLEEEHEGGCVLFTHRAEVEGLLAGTR